MFSFFLPLIVTKNIAIPHCITGSAAIGISNILSNSTAIDTNKIDLEVTIKCHCFAPALNLFAKLPNCPNFSPAIDCRSVNPSTKTTQ